MIYPIKHLPPVIPVGVQTESGVESIGFDVKPWLDEFDGLSFSVWLTRPGDDSAYPAGDVELVGTVLYWKPNSVDTAVAGSGKVEILAITGDKRKLSGWCGTMVKATSLTATQETPEAARPWVDEVLEAADEAKRHADRAEEIANDLAGGGFSGTVRFDKPQDLTEEQKEQARENIGATIGQEGPQGPPGDTRVYVGSDLPPEGAEVWINPQGTVEEDEIPGVKVEETEDGVMITAINWDGVTQALVRHGKDGEPGYTPVKGVDYFDGAPGKDGEPGSPGKDGNPGKNGQDGISPVVSVQSVSGGHRVTITDKDGVKAFDVMDGKDVEGSTVEVDNTLTVSGAAADAKATGDKFTELSEEIAKLPQGGGGGAAIIDVAELPETDIREDVFYRLLTGTFYFNGAPMNGYVCHIVDALPETGEPATDATMTAIVAYYNTTDESLNGYLPAELAGAFGLPAGWYPAEMLFQVVGVEYGGAITDVENASTEWVLYLLLEYAMYQHKSGVWTAFKSIGLAGTSIGAEVFNYFSNTASGEYSHAEGKNTTASGEYSHAEGVQTTASGYFSSHAEGYGTTASGDFGSHAEGDGTTASGGRSHSEGVQTTASGESSHAEGNATTASGAYSHAEGVQTTASGACAHAEGSGTTAASMEQHVQGRYNIKDEANKYAHIVGNGTNVVPSNAHTLDWKGNAWYKGTVESAGILLTAPDGTKYKLTVANGGTLTATVVTE